MLRAMDFEDVGSEIKYEFMMEKDFWMEYWQKDDMIFRDHLQSKIGRTINGQPISDEMWNKTTQYIADLMRCEKSHFFLDVCAGSGVFSDFFSTQVHGIDAVDISEPLLSNIKAPNVNKIIGDLSAIKLDKEKYDRVLFYFAIQHFSLQELPQILNNIFQSCKSGAVVLIGDIPDIEKKYDFFNSSERRAAYFNSLITCKPIIGEWFFRQDLVEMAKFIGFTKVTFLPQPGFCINAHYRFDLILEVER
jgi:ubiquinone/menaquinone biosynthesis C-methylase UbiE